MNEAELSHKLRMIGKEIPRDWKEKGVVTERIFAEQKERAEKYVRTGKIRGRIIPEEQLRKLEKLIKGGTFDRTTEKIDPVIAKKIDSFVDYRVKRAMENGELPSKADPFYLSRVKRN